MATIYEVAKLAGVSLATVSRVINASGKVRDTTRDKVLKAMEQLDYHPNLVAQSLASRRSNCVGVLVSELSGPIFGPMLSAIEMELKKAGKFTIVTAGHSDAGKESEGIQFLTDRKCDALILHVEALPTEYFIERQSELLPFVLLNRHSERLRSNCFYLDNEMGGYLAAKTVLELGHRKIGYVSGPLGWGDAGARLQGHRRALREFGVSLDERLLVEGDFKETTGGTAAQVILDSGLSATAIICANDEMAAGAMDKIRQRGLSIPGDISVVGFDNVRWARFLHPKLTTVNYPIDEMSLMAAQWVLKNVYDDDSFNIRYDFKPDLVVRESTGPVATR